MASSQAASLITEAIKTLAVGAVQHTAPTRFNFGTVTSAAPLVIRIDQKISLSDDFLILTNAVKDHAVDITVSWQTVEDNYLDDNARKHTHTLTQTVGNIGAPVGGSTDPSIDFDTTHKHDIKGRKKITVHNGLTVGEKVLLCRIQGGQKYVVIDRIDEAPTTGESV